LGALVVGRNTIFLELRSLGESQIRGDAGCVGVAVPCNPAQKSKNTPAWRKHQISSCVFCPIINIARIAKPDRAVALEK
jgi:hypothetical protein